MPLSEHEQRQLEQIEQALYRADPKFGRLVRSSDPRVHYKRKLAQAVIGIAAGAGLLAAGVVTHRVYLEAAGAAVVRLALVWAVVSWRRHLARVRPVRAKASAKAVKGQGRPGPGGPGVPGRAAQTRRARMMERMEERWRRRPEGGRMSRAASRSPRAAPGPPRHDPVWNPRRGLAQDGHHRGGEDGRAPAGRPACVRGQAAACGGAVLAQVL